MIRCRGTRRPSPSPRRPAAQRPDGDSRLDGGAVLFVANVSDLMVALARTAYEDAATPAPTGACQAVAGSDNPGASNSSAAVTARRNERPAGWEPG